MEQQKLQLAVAKAAFSASLSLPSDPKVSPQLVSAFQSLLTTVTSHPSQRNIKETRTWLLENCHSAKQITAAVRFLSALSATLPTFKERLTLLYVVNDVLFHSANTFRETKEYVASAALQYLPALVKTIRSARDAQVEPLRKVIQLWSEKNYFSVEEFKQIAEEPLTEDKPREEEDKMERKPLIKPSMLGNLGDPHWLLPVSCMLEVVESSNNYKPIFPAMVKAIKLSPTTDPEILDRVESFETSVHEWKFKEEEGSEGEEFDGEGWNLVFWSGIEQRRLRRTQERLRRQLMEKVGRLHKPTTMTRGRSPSPMEGASKRSRSRSSSGSRGRSRSPRRRRERSYSYSPPRRKRGRSRSVSRSPSPRGGKWSPPPPSSTHETIPPRPHNYQSSQLPPPHSYPGVPPPQSLYQYNIPPQNYQGPPPQQYSYPPPPQPSQTGYYRADGPPVANAPWEQRGVPPSGAPPWQQPPSGPQGGNYGRGDYAQRGHSQHRKWL